MQFSMGLTINLLLSQIEMFDSQFARDCLYILSSLRDLVASSEDGTPATIHVKHHLYFHLHQHYQNCSYQSALTSS